MEKWNIIRAYLRASRLILYQSTNMGTVKLDNLNVLTRIESLLKFQFCNFVPLLQVWL